jgi:hypothetical protein
LQTQAVFFCVNDYFRSEIEGSYNLLYELDIRQFPFFDLLWKEDPSRQDAPKAALAGNAKPFGCKKQKRGIIMKRHQNKIIALFAAALLLLSMSALTACGSADAVTEGGSHDSSTTMSSDQTVSDCCESDDSASSNTAESKNTAAVTSTADTTDTASTTSLSGDCCG